MLYEVFKNLSVRDIHQVCIVSSKFYPICQDEHFWSSKFRVDLDDVLIQAKPKSLTALAWYKYLREDPYEYKSPFDQLYAGIEFNSLNLVKYAVQHKII